jgi:hypothetical protein
MGNFAQPSAIPVARDKNERISDRGYGALRASKSDTTLPRACERVGVPAMPARASHQQRRRRPRRQTPQGCARHQIRRRRQLLLPEDLASRSRTARPDHRRVAKRSPATTTAPASMVVAD